MQTACLYHADCLDGAAAAAAVRHKYPDAELHPMDHGEPPPEALEGKRVFIVDFSFDGPTLRAIEKQAAELHWYDHHKTALPVQEEVGFGTIDLDESGATLSWKQLFPGEDVPKILQYVRDKDIWLWELPQSREISADLREMDGILNPADPIWEKLIAGPSDHEWQAMIERGTRSRRLLKQRIEKAVAKGFRVSLDGIEAFAVNWVGDASDIGEHIYKELGHKMAIIFSFKGGEWSFSLRSNQVDVSEVAVQHGGGGHPGASGFRSETIDWFIAQRIQD